MHLDAPWLLAGDNLHLNHITYDKNLQITLTALASFGAKSLDTEQY